MNLPNYVPTPEESLKRVSRILPHLHPAFEHAVFQSTNYMETNKLDYDVNSMYMMIRLHVKNYLAKRNIPHLKLEDYSLEGLSFFFDDGDDRWRTWKADNYELPPPGTSATKQAYYNTQYSLPFNGREAKEINRFAILWNLGPKNEVKLWLVCPKSYDDETKKADSWWFVALDDPTLAIAPPPSTPPEALPLEPKTAQEKKKKE